MGYVDLACLAVVMIPLSVGLTVAGVWLARNSRYDGPRAFGFALTVAGLVFCIVTGLMLFGFAA